MQHRQTGRLARLEQRYGPRLCVGHHVDIVIRYAAGREEGMRSLCRRCGRPATLHVIEFQVVPDRARE